MMDLVKYFNNTELSINLTTLLIDNEPYFIAKEVATILGYDDTTQTIRKNVDELDQKMLSYTECKDLFGDMIEDCKDIEDAEDVQSDENLSPVYQTGLKSVIKINPFGMKLINESGLYSLTFASRKPEAKAFKRWVTSEVLPSIRKTGSYGISISKEERLMLNVLTAETKEARLVALDALEQHHREEKRALEVENETLTQERDHAIKTKSQINDKRTASLMGKTGALTKENTKLKSEKASLEEQLKIANNSIIQLEAEREIACLGLYHPKDIAEVIKSKFNLDYTIGTIKQRATKALKIIALEIGEPIYGKPNPKDPSFAPSPYFTKGTVDQLFECIGRYSDYFKSFK